MVRGDERGAVEESPLQNLTPAEYRSAESVEGFQREMVALHRFVGDPRAPSTRALFEVEWHTRHRRPLVIRVIVAACSLVNDSTGQANRGP